MPSLGKDSKILHRSVQCSFFILVAALAIANGFFIKQNRDLKAAISKRQPEYLEIGQAVPPLVAHKLSGETTTINYSDSPRTVLFVFSADCRACEQTAPYWREIERAFDSSKARTFALSLGDAEKSRHFLDFHGLTSELLSNIDTRTRQAYRLSMTPLTIVVNSEGRIERMWAGTLSENQIKDVESYFHISLSAEMK